MEMPEAMMRRAISAQKRGDLQGACRILEDILRTHPDYLPAMSALGAILLEMGILQDAKRLLLRALEKWPDSIPVLYNLARAYQMEGKQEDAELLYEKIIDSDPDFGYAWNNLGLVLRETGRVEQAVVALERAVSLMPDFPPAFNNLGVVLEMVGRFEEARTAFERAICLAPDYPAPRFNLGCMLFRLEQFDEARRHLIWIEQNHGPDPTASFLLKCMGQDGLPERAPLEYVEKTFDDCAASFERNLLVELEYMTPERLFQLVRPYLSKGMKILDLGCGTGLGAEYYKPFASLLIGLDCSEKMLLKAREKNVYDRLLKADILGDWEADDKFDLIYSSDCLCYFGELLPVFLRVKDVLSPCAMFAFSVETNDDVEDDYILGIGGRYVHGKKYLEDAIEKAGYELLDMEKAVLRKEKGENVMGLLAVIRIR